MKKRFVIGITTGRCGSMSFAKFMNNQKNTTFTHEKMDVTMWPLFGGYTRAMNHLKGYGGKFVGDISPGWASWAVYLLRYHPDSKIVWLHRDKEEVVDSFIRQKESRPQWFTSFDGPDGYMGAYPVQELEYSRDAVRRCIDRTYWLCKSFRTLYPEHVYLIDMYSLNDHEQQYELLSWIGYRDRDMVLGMTHENRS